MNMVSESGQQLQNLRVLVSVETGVCCLYRSDTYWQLELEVTDFFLQVGTYIGERLIYAPSIGFCILVAELLSNLAGDALPQILLLWYTGGCAHPTSPVSPVSHGAS